MALLALPREMLCHILAHISVPDLLTLGCVNKELSSLTKVFSPAALARHQASNS